MARLMGLTGMSWKEGMVLPEGIQSNAFMGDFMPEHEDVSKPFFEDDPKKVEELFQALSDWESILKHEVH